MKSSTAIINSTLVISIALCSASFSQTPTPTPNPCAACPAPGSIGCIVNEPACIACWEACGQPIATPTPTPTNTPTVTATPTATPTPWAPPANCDVVECDLRSTNAGTVYLIAVFEHQDPARPGMRYTCQTPPQTLEPGKVARPGPYDACPVGFEWWHIPPDFTLSVGDVLVKSCGDTDRLHPHFFSDGFETGDTSRWSRVF
jgi:hypothetical protein